MKKVIRHQREWEITESADRAPNQSKNLMHGNNTIIGDVPATLTLSQGRGRYHGAACGKCAGFDACRKNGATAGQDYCLFYPARFARAFQPITSKGSL